MKTSLIVTLMVSFFAMTLAACAQEDEPREIRGHLELSAETVLLTTTTDGRHTMVSGYIGDQGPYSFLIDSGSTPNAIDVSLAEALGLEVVDHREVMSGGTVPMQVEIVEVPEIQIGGMRIVGAGFITMPIAEMTGGNSHGMIGMDLFQELMISYDSPNATITVSTEGLDADAPGVSAMETDGVGITFRVDFAGHMVPMHVDTGAPNGFTLPASMIGSIPTLAEPVRGPDARLAGGYREIHEATLDGDIHFGGDVYSNPQIQFMSEAISGNLGGAVLNQYVLSIDQINGLIGLQSSGPRQATVAEASAGPRRIGVRFRGQPSDAEFIATDVRDRSLSSEAGLMVGDVLVVLNGAPIASYTMRSLGALFRSQEPLQLEVLRDGETHLIEIG